VRFRARGCATLESPSGEHERSGPLVITSARGYRVRRRRLPHRHGSATFPIALSLRTPRPSGSNRSHEGWFDGAYSQKSLKSPKAPVGS